MDLRERLEPRKFQMRAFRDGSNQVLALSGELDADNCPAVEEELLRIYSANGHRVVVDLMGLTFIDSTAISLLVRATRRSENDGGRLRFVPSESEDVHRLLELCGLNAHLPFVQDGTSD
jgi:anti-anti-sigma factor